MLRGIKKGLKVKMSNPVDLWNKILGYIKATIAEDAFNTWFIPLAPKEIRQGKLIIEAPNLFFVEWIEEYYRSLINEGLKWAETANTEVIFKPKKDGELKDEGKKPSPLPKNSEKFGIKKPFSLNPKYTFENFVVGESNRFAQACAKRVAEEPGSFNPLFIYGGVGLGKTHLLHAIGNYRKSKNTNTTLYLTSCENFFIEFIQAIKDGNTIAFKNKYRQIDLLLLDDIHYLIGKESLQEEIFHTFNYLHSAGRQIVFTSDRPPKEIPTLEERLSSRLGSGLVCDIGPPDLETRIAILKKKAEQEDCSFSQEIYNFLAERIKTNIRDLESALIRLIAHRSIFGNSLTLKSVEEILKDLLPPKEEYRGEEIIQEVLSEFSVSKKELFSPVRTKRIALARQVAMYLMRRLLCLPLKEIGSIFGGKDHTTVIHACEKIEKMIKDNSGIGQRIERIILRLKSQ